MPNTKCSSWIELDGSHDMEPAAGCWRCNGRWPLDRLLRISRHTAVDLPRASLALQGSDATTLFRRDGRRAFGA